MSMAAIERARLATCEELLRSQAALIVALQKRVEALESLRPTLSVRARPKEPALPV
jgi:hypothetical protein